MGDFKTKIDLSNNRQVKQYPRTVTALSGATQFGVPFSALTTGPDLATTGVTSSYTLLNDSTFTGTDSSITFTWIDPIMALGYDKLVPITPSNSGDTQYTYGFEPSETAIIDGNTVNLAYTGITFDIVVTAFADLGGGNYSGSVDTSQIVLLTAGPLDFTSRTIWVDVNGITRTQKLIVTDGIYQCDILVKTKTVNIGSFDLSNNSDISIAHGLGSKFTGITDVSITILSDDKSKITTFTNQGGSYYEADSSNITLYKVGTYYNNSNYEGTDDNRGYITITYLA